MHPLKDRLRSLVRRSGWDVVRFRGDFARHQGYLLDQMAIDVVADVGANEGQYASRLRLLGFRGQIVSFEPYPQAAERLLHRARRDTRWSVHEVAIGARRERTTLNVSANSVSSSLLSMTRRHLEADRYSGYISTVDVDLQPLDYFLGELPGRLWLKIDVQGAERAVLEGARAALVGTQVLQAELSLVELYRDAPTAHDLIDYLDFQGFTLVDLERGFCDPRSGALLQADGLFLRRDQGKRR